MTGNARVELQKIVSQLKAAQKAFAEKLNKDAIIDRARTYAEQQRAKYQGLLKADLSIIRTYTEKEMKELHRIREQLPKEIKRLQAYVATQRSELDKVLKSIRAAAVNGRKVKKVKKTKKKSTKAPAKSAT